MKTTELNPGVEIKADEDKYLILVIDNDNLIATRYGAEIRLKNDFYTGEDSDWNYFMIPKDRLVRIDERR